MKAVPAIAYCQRIAVPVVVGILKPTILLPSSLASGFAPDQIEAIITHELAHIRRFDLLVNLLQRIVESLLFFHPAVWYVSRQVSNEREHCCDDFVLSSGCQRMQYADALICMAELCGGSRGSSAAAQIATMAATGSNNSQLRQRVMRVLGDEPRPRLTRVGMLKLTLVATALIASTVFVQSWGNNAVGQGSGNVEMDSEEAEWGKTNRGLRCRAIAVSAEMNEDEIDLSEPKSRFEHPNQVAFAVELENVSDQPIKLLEPNSNWLAQFLFSIEFFDTDGKKIEQPKAELWHLAPYQFRQALQTTLEPGKTQRYLLRPAKWMSLTIPRLDAGKYRAVVHYRGVPSDAVKHFPDAWSSDVASMATTFEIGPPTDGLMSHYAPLVWGEKSNGLRAALELRPNKTSLVHGDTVDAKMHVQNVSDKPIAVWPHFRLAAGLMTAVDEQGHAVEMVQGRIVALGIEPYCRVVISPQQTMTVDAAQLHIEKLGVDTEKLRRGGRRAMFAPNGKYKLQFQYGFWHNNDRDWSGPLNLDQARPNTLLR